MTTIAYRDGILASDSLCTSGLTRMGMVQKIYRLRDGRLYGAAGDAGTAEQMRRHLDRPDLVERPDLKETACLTVDPDGSLTFWEGAASFPVIAPFVARGSGRDFALGAMSAGASAAQAVQIGIDFDCGSGGRVQVLKLRE